MRESIVAGQFYEHDKNKLTKQLEGFFKGLRNERKKIYGVIAPHAGYFYSGKCAGFSYNQLKESDADIFLILGVNHTGLGSEFTTLLEDFKTPLGIAKVDKEFGKELMKMFPELKNDFTAHLNEHSIEVQLPFLQYIKKDFKFLPVIVSTADLELIRKFAKSVVDISKKLNKKIAVIASSDFTHYGESYGYIPFTENIKDKMYKLDKEVIEFVLKLDSRGFLDYINKTNATICGICTIITCIEIVKLMGAKKGVLLNYYTSGDIADNYESAVGYASVSFE